MVPYHTAVIKLEVLRGIQYQTYIVSYSGEHCTLTETTYSHVKFMPSTEWNQVTVTIDGWYPFSSPTPPSSSYSGLRTSFTQEDCCRKTYDRPDALQPSAVKQNINMNTRHRHLMTISKWIGGQLNILPLSRFVFVSIVQKLRLR